MNIAGAWARYVLCFYFKDFRFVLIGQALIAIASPFFQNGPSKLATKWFGDNERALATTIASLSPALGCIIGLGLAP